MKCKPEYANFCDRCRRGTNITTMSMFNTQMCCITCLSNERLHPRFPDARKAELAAVQQGNLNFHGIGLPEDLEPYSKTITEET